MTDNPGIIKTLREIFRFLPVRRTLRFWIILTGMVAVALLETITAGAIAFYAASMANPQAVITGHLPCLQHMAPVIINLDTKGLISILSICVILLIIIKNAAMAATAYASKFFAANISGYLGEYMLKGFLNLPYEWHLQHNSADLIQGISWRQQFGNLITAALKLLSDMLIVTILLTTLLIANPVISLLVFMTLGGTSLLIIRHIRQGMERLAIRHRDYTSSINRQVTQSMHGIKEVKIYNRSSTFTERYDQEVHTFARIDASLHFINQLPGWLLEIMGATMLAMSIWIMFFWFGDSSVKITGTIALLAVASWRILPAMSRILNSANAIRQALPYVHSGLDYLHEIETKSTPDPDTISGGSFKSELKLENVSFQYQGANRMALSSISLTIQRGRTIGIIGTSGAGKSTLVDIIIGLLTPTNGALLLDGEPLTTNNMKGWQAKIGYVPQSPYIAPATLAENVAFGINQQEINHDKVLSCCRMAAMDDFMHQLPDGLNSFIGERGVKLSGGQRQRVAIARALYHNPEVIIFDEATSALDSKNEESIQQTIYSLKNKMTLIIIAHRLSTVEDCDEIVWLEDGLVEKTGETNLVLSEYKKRHKENSSDHKNFHQIIKNKE